MNTTTETRTNSYGFPIVDCPRCDGTGRFGPESVEGGRCFGCLGAKTVVKAGKARKAWVAFTKAQPKKEAILSDLQVGTKVLPGLAQRKLAGMEWVEITKIEITPERCGWSLTGTDEADRIHYYYRWITLSDGTCRKLSENSLVRRCVTADMIPNPRDYWPGKAVG
jgi:hypothetical protein